MRNRKDFERDWERFEEDFERAGRRSEALGRLVLGISGLISAAMIAGAFWLLSDPERAAEGIGRLIAATERGYRESGQ